MDAFDSRVSPRRLSEWLTKRESTEGLHASIGITGVDILAMVVSDSGLANAEPKWWNASPMGCVLIGMQPRGGWQIIQRCVQWGDDGLARCFGVACEPPTLYAYFACTIRNRLEVLDSKRFRSPTVGLDEGVPWQKFEASSFTVLRPTKLIDGSRGGQAFTAELLRPHGAKQYSIVQQSRLQLLSVLLVGAGLTCEDVQKRYMEEVLPLDFDMADGLGSVFKRLLFGLGLASCVCICFTVGTWWSLLRASPFGPSLPYVVKLASLFSWSVGATGLLMLGGNPRVKVVKGKIPAHILERLDKLSEDGSSSSREAASPTASTLEDQVVVVDPTVEVRFGSLHGSVFTPGGGSCALPLSLVRDICAVDVKTVRRLNWYLGAGWFGALLVGALALQIGSRLAPSFGADMLSLGILLATSLARGAGVAGPESWMIPRWKRRPDTSHGAKLVGQYCSRTGTEV